MPSLIVTSTSQPLPCPPPLGFPIPSDRHAVSVQLPTWQDMCGMISQEPRVVQVQQIGYPRSFLNQDVTRVNDACLLRFGHCGEKCLVFPSHRHALACRDMIVDQVPTTIDLIRVQAVDLFLDDRSAEEIDHSSLRRFYVTFFPSSVAMNAMAFWRLTGTGISSRLAQSMHRFLDKQCLAPTQLTDASLHRQLGNDVTDQTLRSRIVTLIQRASISADMSCRLTTSDVFLYPTGMAAIYETNELLKAWRSEQTIVFGFPYELTLKIMQKYGLDCRFYGFGTSEELDNFEAYLADRRQRGRMIQSVWCECASNPLLKTVDLARIRRLADTYGFVVVVDETIGSFANVDVTGVADLIITSLTKSFSGKANVMAGSIVLNPALPFYGHLKTALKSTFVNELFGEDSLVLEYNSRKFLHRAAKMNRNAQHLVQVLSPHAKASSSTLTHVYHPSTCEWSRANYEARMRKVTSDFTPGYGGLFTLEFESVLASATFFDALNVHKGPSLGASVTLAQPYVQTVFMREKAWAASYGLSETIVRISVGLEDEQSLAQEFLRALRLADRFKAGYDFTGNMQSCF